jgi:pimeloyl-ACP methyl ester carboxylesterase
MEMLAAKGFCAIAPDNPGNGNSQALPGYETDVAAYARALKALFDALGLKRVGLYGFHTGAAHACAFAALYPTRVSGAVLQGLPVWSAEERGDILAHYLPPFTPHWDGSHLAWLWARLEEQTIFFPWYDRRRAARMAGFGGVTAAALHDNAMDLLRAGDAYRALYESAFVFEGEPWAAKLSTPTLLTATPSDPLAAHIARLPALPAQTETLLGIADWAAYGAAMTDYLTRHPGDAAPDAVEGGIDAQGRTRGFVTCNNLSLAFEGPFDATTLFLPDIGESDLLYRDSAHMTLNLPGHGEGASTWNNIGGTLDSLGEHIRPFVRALDRKQLTGVGLGGALAQKLGGESARAIEPDAPAPDLTPRIDGAHFIMAWRYLRKRALFRPWTSFHADDWRDGEPALDEAHMQNQLISLFLAQPHLHAAYAINPSASGG